MSSQSDLQVQVDDKAQDSTELDVSYLYDSTDGVVSSILDGDGDQLSGIDEGKRQLELALAAFDRELSSYIERPPKRSYIQEPKSKVTAQLVSALDLPSFVGDGESSDSSSFESLVDDELDHKCDDKAQESTELAASPLDLPNSSGGESSDTSFDSLVDDDKAHESTEQLAVSALDLPDSYGGEPSDSSFESLVDDDKCDDKTQESTELAAFDLLNSSGGEPSDLDGDGDHLASEDLEKTLSEEDYAQQPTVEPEFGQEDESKRATTEVSDDDGGKQQLELHLSPFDQELVALSDVVDSPLEYEKVQVESEEEEEDKVETKETEQVADNLMVVSGPEAEASDHSTDPKETKEEDDEDEEETWFGTVFHKDTFLEFLFHAL